MLKQFCTIVVLIVCSQVVTSKASSTLAIDQDFNVISVNGKSYKSGFLTSDTIINLYPGVNKIAIQYEVVFDQEDNFDLIKSDTLLVSFYADRNENYLLNYLKPANSRAARVFAKNPVINILNQSGKRLKASSFFLGSNNEGFVNQQTRPSIAGQQPIKIIATKKGQTAEKQSNQKAPNAEQQLEYWWSKATAQQRQSFLKTIKVKP